MVPLTNSMMKFRDSGNGEENYVEDRSVLAFEVIKGLTDEGRDVAIGVLNEKQIPVINGESECEASFS